MSGLLTLDASVLVKVFMDEPGTPAARALVGGAATLVGPELCAVEVSSAIARRHRLGAIAHTDAQNLLGAARNFFKSGAVSLTEDMSLLSRAEEIALDLKHALKDCLYIALAEKTGADLVTTDKALVSRAATHFAFVRAL